MSTADVWLFLYCLVACCQHLQLSQLNCEQFSSTPPADETARLLSNAMKLCGDDVTTVRYLADVLLRYRELKVTETARRDSWKLRHIDVLVASHLQVTTPRNKPKRYLGEFTNDTADELSPTWKKFNDRISSVELYSESDGLVDQLLEDMKTMPVSEMEMLPDCGTILKVILYLSDNSAVLFKPKRVERDYVVPDDLFYMYDVDRHTAEIAAFHLDRLLGFRRVPPVVGVKVDLQILYQLADDEIKQTFYISPVRNRCFYGKCQYFCEPAHAVCGNPSLVEGSVVHVVPSQDLLDWTELDNPWERTYSKFEQLAEWQDPRRSHGYCEKARRRRPFDNIHTLLNLIDLHIFDFLAGNMDRHSLHTFLAFGNDSYFITFDNGRGFGKAGHDELSILAPLYQCCMVRLSTVETLLHFHTSPSPHRLSDAMRTSLQRDPLSPILTEDHLEALDRRLAIIIEHINTCVASYAASSHQVIIQD